VTILRIIRDYNKTNLRYQVKTLTPLSFNKHDGFLQIFSFLFSTINKDITTPMMVLEPQYNTSRTPSI